MYSTRCTHLNEERTIQLVFSTDTIRVLDDGEKNQQQQSRKKTMRFAEEGGQYLL